MKKLSYVLIAIVFAFTANLQAQQTQINNLQDECDTETVFATVTAKKVSQTYDVRIELVDERSGSSVPAGTLPGYVATNQATGQNYYTDRYYYDQFFDLPAGTYRFDAYDGYFDGASSEIVTLSSSLEGNDGFIVVTLSYWSE